MCTEEDLSWSSDDAATKDFAFIFVFAIKIK
jgi:hypothetical protein